MPISNTRLLALPPVPRCQQERLDWHRFSGADCAQRKEDRQAECNLVLLQAGEAAAFDRLYDHLYGPLYEYAIRLLGDRDDAEDIVQDVFTTILRVSPTFDSRRGSARAWVFAIAHNRALDHLRKRARSRAATLEESIDGVVTCSAEEDSVRAENGQALTLLRVLPRTQRQVLWLRYVADFSTEQTATLLGRSSASVRQLQHRGLARLALELK